MGLLFVLLASITYSGALRKPLGSDARYLTSRNTYNQDASGLVKMWTSDYFAGAVTGALPANSGYYRPITNTFIWLEYRVVGERERLYTLTEVLLHAVNAFLVFLLCARIFENRGASLAAGLIFLLHPVHAFAATEAAARADVLFPVFFLLAVLVFDSALESEKGVGWKLSLATVLYLLSVLSKEMGVTLPAVLALLVLFRHFRDGDPLRRLTWTAPAWAAFALYAIWRFGVVGVETQSVGYGEHHSSVVLGLGALRGIVIHVSRIVFPFGASYPELNPWLINYLASPFTNPLTYAALAVASALGALALAWKWNPRLAFWSGFFIVTYSPLMRVDNIAGAVGHNLLLAEERWIYLPAVAIAALAGWGLAALIERPTWARLPRPATAGVAFAVLAVLGVSSAVHAGKHSDPLARLRRLYLLPEEQLDRMDQANKLLLYATWVAAPLYQLDDAEARARRAVQLVPDSPIPAAALGHILVLRKKWEEVIPVLVPWVSPSLEELEGIRATNFRVIDDLNRVAPKIPHTLARAHAHLGNSELAIDLLCEAARRGYEAPEVETALREVYAEAGLDVPLGRDLDLPVGYAGDCAPWKEPLAEAAGSPSPP